MDVNDTSLQQILQYVHSQPPEYLIGTATGVLTWIVMGCLLAKGKIFQAKKRRVEKYTKMGHRLVAELFDVTHHQSRGDRYYRAFYRYTVDGKTYERAFSINGPPPHETYIYYDKDPQKAFFDGEMKERYQYILWFVIPLSAALAATLLSAFLLGRF